VTVFDTSLLREKFYIINLDSAGNAAPIIATSNRMVCALRNHKGEIEETFIIRTHNMHSCIRFVSRLVQAYNTGGALMNRQTKYDWDGLWQSIFNDFERLHNPLHWAAVYHKGKLVFSKGDHHAFLDMIEKIDYTSDRDYDHSKALAEKAFLDTGKTVRIDYKSSVACIIDIEPKGSRVGFILRDVGQTGTFNFKILNSALRPHTCISAAAAFLEIIQLCFLIGTTRGKLQVKLINKHSDEFKRLQNAMRRKMQLMSEISILESNYGPRYRPEKPDFDVLIENAKSAFLESQETP
jgi:hypothetical protein